MLRLPLLLLLLQLLVVPPLLILLLVAPAAAVFYLNLLLDVLPISSPALSPPRHAGTLLTSTSTRYSLYATQPTNRPTKSKQATNRGTRRTRSTSGPYETR